MATREASCNCGQLSVTYEGPDRFPGETSCLTLVWAVLHLYIGQATNGIKFTELERRHLKRVRYGEHDETIPEELAVA